MTDNPLLNLLRLQAELTATSARTGPLLLILKEPDLLPPGTTMEMYRGELATLVAHSSRLAAKNCPAPERTAAPAMTVNIRLLQALNLIKDQGAENNRRTLELLSQVSGVLSSSFSPAHVEAVRRAGEELRALAAQDATLAHHAVLILEGAFTNPPAPHPAAREG